MPEQKKTSKLSLISSLAHYLKIQNYSGCRNEKPLKTKAEKLLTLKKRYLHCQACPLGSEGRSQVVFGAGNPQAQLMFIGEGPGRDEDAQGEPFIGRAGKLLTKIITAMGLKREDVYITNTVKCRPPQNRTPFPSESATCKQLMLFKEIEIIQPQIICTLGASALYATLGQNHTLSRSRGEFHLIGTYKVMPTYHPAYLLRNPSAKRAVWEDMKKITKEMSEMNMAIQKTRQKN